MNLILGKSLLPSNYDISLDYAHILFLSKGNVKSRLALSNLHPSWSPVRLKDSETNQCSKLGFFSAELLRVSVTFTKGSAKF